MITGGDMPRMKRHLGTYNRGTVVEREVTDETQWIQLCGTTVVRCDDDAKENGWGLWVVERFGGYRQSWVGRRPGPVNGLVPYFPEQELWMREDWKKVYVEEKDYS